VRGGGVAKSSKCIRTYSSTTARQGPERGGRIGLKCCSASDRARFGAKNAQLADMRSSRGVKDHPGTVAALMSERSACWRGERTVAEPSPDHPLGQPRYRLNVHVAGCLFASWESGCATAKWQRMSICHRHSCLLRGLQPRAEAIAAAIFVRRHSPNRGGGVSRRRSDSADTGGPRHGRMRDGALASRSIRRVLFPRFRAGRARTIVE